MLRDQLKQFKVQKIHTYNIGTSVKEKDFMSDKMIADLIFAYIDKPIYDLVKECGHCIILDSGMYACIYSDCYDNEIKYAKMLKQYCIDNDYIICGDYTCEVMTEFNVFDSTSRNMFLRLQIPVRFNSK